MKWEFSLIAKVMLGYSVFYEGQIWYSACNDLHPEHGALRSSKTLIPIYKVTWCHKLEDHDQYLHRNDNLKSYLQEACDINWTPASTHMGFLVTQFEAL
jgi:hypothetical protein